MIFIKKPYPNRIASPLTPLFSKDTGARINKGFNPWQLFLLVSVRLNAMRAISPQFIAEREINAKPSFYG